MPRRQKMSPTGDKSDSDAASSAHSVPVRNDDQRSVFSYGDDDLETFTPSGAAIAEVSEFGSSQAGDLDLSGNAELKTSFEDKFTESLDLAVEKRATVRVEALKFLCRSLQARVMPGFILPNVATLTEIIDKNLRKGKTSEDQILATHLAGLVSMQLGVEYFRSGYKTLRDLFLTMMLNDANPMNVRAAIATSIGVCTFFGDEEPSDLARILSKLSTCFEAGYTSSDIPQAVQPDTARFYTKCLQAWSLLMTVAREDVYEKEYKLHGHRLRSLLHSADVGLRIAAGESLTLLQELMSEVDSDFELPYADEVVDEMRKLATDSLRYRSKNDRRFQRSTFRQIVRYMEDGDAYDETIKFGSGAGLKQQLVLDSWQGKLQYDCFCSVLKSGILIHLQANDILRAKFDLQNSSTVERDLAEAARHGIAAVSSSSGGAAGGGANSKAVAGGKRESQLQQAVVHKDRQMKRNKDREKRSKVLSTEPDD